MYIFWFQLRITYLFFYLNLIALDHYEFQIIHSGKHIDTKITSFLKLELFFQQLN